jgi:hypothetical protein
MFWVAGFVLMSLHGISHAADAFSAVSVPQATGFIETTMSIDDTMAIAKRLSAALPKSTSTEGNTSFIVQNGGYNNAQLTQSGTRNVGFIVQSGYYNAAVVQQTGSGHQAFIAQQGIGNTAITRQR